MTSIAIPDSVTSIKYETIYNCTSLTSITIPDSVTSIGEAFRCCISLTSVKYTGTVDQWAQIEFGTAISNPMSYAGDLGDLYINDEIVTEVNLTTAIKISDYAFYNCTGLTSIAITDSVTSIGNFAFGYCTELKSVTLGNKVAFISKGAFHDCTSLTSITIPDSVTSIGDSAFSECYALKKVYYKGGESEWENISIGKYNSALTSATLYYYSASEPALTSDGADYNGNYWHYDVYGITPVIWKKEN